jgi:hypothetical protein
MGVLLRGMAFLLAGKPSGRSTLPVMTGGVHAPLPECHHRFKTPAVFPIM